MWHLSNITSVASKSVEDQRSISLEYSSSIHYDIDGASLVYAALNAVLIACPSEFLGDEF